MGSFFVRYFRGQGRRVSGFDRRRFGRRAAGIRFADSNSEAVRGADVVLVAVPIRETVGVVREALQSIKDGATLVEITSVKRETVANLTKILSKRRVSLLSLHPLFGPHARPKNLKICVIGGRREMSSARRLFPTARLFRLGAGEHDRLMAYTLSLVHMVNLAFASVVTEEAGLKEFRTAASPMATAQLSLSQAVLSQSPSLFSQIETGNPFAREAMSSLVAELMSLKRMIERRDGRRLEKRFAKTSRRFSGTELQKALRNVYSVSS